MSAAPAPLLRFDGVSCLRGGRMLFRKVDFTIEAGSALIVSGSNGTGKSSLLRLAAGLLRPYAGQVERRATTALSDEALALDERTPLGLALSFWAQLDEGQAEAGLEAMAISHLAQVPVRMLSTGQRKRATLARVIASKARLWLLDEPANGLDLAGQALLAAVVTAHRKHGGAVVAASHQPLGVEGARTLTLEGAGA